MFDLPDKTKLALFLLDREQFCQLLFIAYPSFGKSETLVLNARLLKKSAQSKQLSF